MLDLIKKFFSSPLAPEEATPDEMPVHDIRIATCALLLEMARIDGEFSPRERDEIFAILKKVYGLSRQVAEQLHEEVERELEPSIDLWKFTNLINENYSEDEKLKVIELVWQIVYADGKLDMHEDYLVHKLATLLNIEHRQLITAKLRILNRQ